MTQPNRVGAHLEQSGAIFVAASQQPGAKELVQAPHCRLFCLIKGHQLEGRDHIHPMLLPKFLYSLQANGLFHHQLLHWPDAVGLAKRGGDLQQLLCNLGVLTNLNTQVAP